jgi:hypothetical protein
VGSTPILLRHPALIADFFKVEPEGRYIGDGWYPFNSLFCLLNHGFRPAREREPITLLEFKMV